MHGARAWLAPPLLIRADRTCLGKPDASSRPPSAGGGKASKLLRRSAAGDADAREWDWDHRGSGDQAPLWHGARNRMPSAGQSDCIGACPPGEDQHSAATSAHGLAPAAPRQIPRSEPHTPETLCRSPGTQLDRVGRPATISRPKLHATETQAIASHPARPSAMLHRSMTVPRLNPAGRFNPDSLFRPRSLAVTGATHGTRRPDRGQSLRSAGSRAPSRRRTPPPTWPTRRTSPCLPAHPIASPRTWSGSQPRDASPP